MTGELAAVVVATLWGAIMLLGYVMVTVLIVAALALVAVGLAHREDL